MEEISEESLTNLCLSVLEQANLDLTVLDDTSQYTEKITRIKLGQMKDAVEYFLSEDTEIFSFFSCCFQAGMDYEEAKHLIRPKVDKAKEFIRKWRASHGSQ